MRLAIVFVTVFAFSLAGLMAQDELTQFQTWMKAGAGGQRAAMKGVQAKDVAATAAAAKDSVAAFESIAAFFKTKGKDDAVKFAEGARDAAKAAAEATTPEDQQAALMKMGPNCQGCHAVYRDMNKFKGL